ncbi:MAG TPA: cupin domain-containing protein [Candidatus Krumholzibacteria bacterium]|nr:cupin domain-containing protein [Candidatus Krumholzibacteria bacterium]
MIHAENLFDGIPPRLAAEMTERMAGNAHARVERIVSHGHASPPGFWYDQAEHEWVMVVKGSARIRFADDSVLELHPGDHFTIPPHTRHRVDWTAPNQDTVWVAVFF